MQVKYQPTMSILSLALLLSNYLLIYVIDFSGEVLIHFVSNFSVLYGDLHVVYNVHSLIHLAKEVRAHGPLDSFSCFSFESYLGKLKRLLRNSRLPLKQIV